VKFVSGKSKRDISWFLGFAMVCALRLADDDVSELFVGSIFKDQLSLSRWKRRVPKRRRQPT
jgi:hypothetical protein